MASLSIFGKGKPVTYGLQKKVLAQPKVGLFAATDDDVDDAVLDSRTRCGHRVVSICPMSQLHHVHHAFL